MQKSPAEHKAMALVLLGLLAASWPATAQTLRLRTAEDVSAFSLQNIVTGLPGTIAGEAFQTNRAMTNQASASALIARQRVAAFLSATAPIPLTGFEDVAVLGASTVTNTGPSVITGNVALTPGTAVTGFPPGTIIGGGIHINDAIATQARAGAMAAYNQLAAELPTSNLSGMNLGGLTLFPGIYRFDTSAQLTGTLRLDTGGDPNAAFHFQIGTMLTTDPASAITLLNGNSVNIFWQVGTSATLGAGSSFAGTIIADQSITLNNGASLEGRALALNGAVTLDTNIITVPTPTPTPVPTVTPSPTPTPIPTVTPSPTPTPIPTVTPSPTPTPIPTVTPSPTATPGPTATPPPGVTPTPSPSPTPPGTFVGGTLISPNLLVLAHALDRLAALHPDNELIQQLNLLPVDQLLAALDLLSPEDLASIFTSGFAVSHVQFDHIEHRLSDVRQGATGFSDSGFAVTDTRTSTRPVDGKDMGSPDGKEVVSPVPAVSLASDKRWGFFISGTGQFVDLESTSAARGYSFDTGGVTVGADYRLTDHFVLGTAFGYANTSTDLNLGGRLRSNDGKGSVYGTYYDKGFYLNGIVGAGYSSLDTTRLTAGGFARGATNGTDFDALLGTGYDYHIGGFSFGPLASLRYARIGIDGFTEEGALGALQIDSQSEDSLRSAIGLQASYTTKLGHVSLTPFVRAQWEHEFLTSTSSIDAGFTSADTFTVQGPHIGRDGVRLNVGISAQLTPRMGIFTYYTGELGRENYNVQSISGGLRVSF